jgi:hypothetical protein
MKPKPLFELKNFTVPVFMTISFQSDSIARHHAGVASTSILSGEDRRKRRYGAETKFNKHDRFNQHIATNYCCRNPVPTVEVPIPTVVHGVIVARNKRPLHWRENDLKVANQGTLWSGPGSFTCR